MKYSMFLKNNPLCQNLEMPDSETEIVSASHGSVSNKDVFYLVIMECKPNTEPVQKKVVVGPSSQILI